MKIGKENFFIIEKIITIIVMVLIVFLSNSSYANDNQTIIEQQEEFKIQDFIKKAEKFTGEFFEDIDINEILNDAIKGEVDNSTLLKKILNILGKEVTTNIKSLVSILAIILIHSILKSISESLENNNISYEHTPSGIDTMTIIVETQSFIKKEQEIFMEQTRLNNSDKPEDILQKIVSGRINKFF